MAVAMAVEVLVVGLVAVEMAAELTVGVAMGEEAAAGLGVEVGIAANRKAVRVERRAEGARVAVVMAVATVGATWAVEAKGKGGEKAAAVPGRAAGAVLLVAPSAAGQVMVGKLVKAVWGRWRRRRRWRRTGRRRRARRWRQRAWWWWWRFG